MSKIIIGIHGLRNKPPQRTLKRWWKKSIREGLKAVGCHRWFFRFELVYWAPLLHPKPLNPRIKTKDHPLHLRSPYRPSKHLEEKKPRRLQKAVLDVLEKQMDKIFLNDDLSINFDVLTDRIIRRYFEDLDTYYSKTILDQQKNEFLAKDLIRVELAKALYKHRRKRILLIAHSMGSIIAYDVLTHTVPDIEIDTLVTIGSPLGIPIIIRKILLEQSDPSLAKNPRTPDNIIGAWYNFSDPEDRAALDHTLADDYQKNSRGVQAVDKVVYNDYENDGERNPHNSYGYLRIPEIANVIHNFFTKSL